MNQPHSGTVTFLFTDIEGSTRLLQELGDGYAEVARIVHGHPTLSEGVMEAARAADGWLIHG